MQNKVVHAAEKKAFELVIDSILKNLGKDTSKNMVQLINMAEKILGDTWAPSAYDMLRNAFSDPEGKWVKFGTRLLNEVDHDVFKKAFMTLGYEAGFRGYRTSQEMAKKYDCNIPWIILMDPTSACNMHCTGCWAAEYGNKYNLSYEDLDSIIEQGKELGIHAYLMTGGEPLVRKKDIIRLCEKHQDCAFHAFTNGTLIDEEFCEDMLRVGNFIPSISIEGFEEQNDGRRGNGHFEKVMHAMDLLKEHKLLFGTSICYTSKNYKTVTSDEFLDLLISKGVRYTWYFHYMPVGNDASTELLLNPEQREYMYHRVREIRDWTGGKEIFAIDFQNDGEFVHGCVAGGRCYCHINPIGDVEPCVFIHYSSANIHEKSLIECLQQPLFRAYRDGQPFNDNELRPCPMLENPEKLQEMIHKTGAVSTDLQSPETCEHLCGKCVEYAKEWTPVANKLWSKTLEEKATNAAK
ncbi:radical SAM protein [Anaerotignum sp. MSJ-24]|uniref:radical SAM protein n=1 Tax=Anaerotignum sp. MSJ-24 TaxID=2841521 RepID=UPI001C12827E|nr:radical SAM protein [Anaerotignum sp. MSJ-24]MBU5464255.1 radical SAM protein [Anaerotignum sp. MSJ-24]